MSRVDEILILVFCTNLIDNLMMNFLVWVIISLTGVHIWPNMQIFNKITWHLKIKAKVLTYFSYEYKIQKFEFQQSWMRLKLGIKIDIGNQVKIL